MSAEFKIYPIITIITSLFMIQSVCRAQDIYSNITNETDTTHHLVPSDSTSDSNDKEQKSSEKYLTNDYFPSLALRNNKNDDNQNLLHGKKFEPFSLRQKVENKISSKNELQYQMIDGTYWREESAINKLRLFTTFGAIAAVDLIAFTYASNVWYKEETTGFHTIDFNTDMRKGLYMDKIGHLIGAYFASDLTSKLYRWSGMSGNSSVWYGALTGWLWMLQIEMSDGFMADWGYSWGDFLANTIGAGYFVLQQFNYELLGGIHPKFSWHKSDAWKNGEYVNPPQSIIQDYEGMTFWLTFNFHHYFTEKWKEDYPKWLAPLGIAIGYSAKGISKNLLRGRKEFFIGMDIDLRKVPFLDDWGLFRFLKSELNFIRLPLPAIRISQGSVWYGLYF